MNIIALFNNKGGVGKTTVVYHLAHMFARLGISTLAVDLDPQANLTSMFFNDDEIEELWESPKSGETIYSCIKPVIDGVGDIAEPNPIEIDDKIFVLSGDLRLSSFEDKLSTEWPGTLQQQVDALRVTTAFYRIIKKGGEKKKAEIALVDVGPNLGAINRVSLLSADYILVPLGADLFSLQGLRNLGPTIGTWRETWQTIRNLNKNVPLELPEGSMKHLGYIILQHAVKQDRSVRSYEKWLQRIPATYHSAVLGEKKPKVTLHDDPYCLSLLRHYRSLIPMAQEARKPIFDLKPADGAIGSHVRLVRTAYEEFENLAKRIQDKIQL